MLEPSDLNAYRAREKAVLDGLSQLGAKLPEAVIHDDDAANTGFLRMGGRSYEFPRVKIGTPAVASTGSTAATPPAPAAGPSTPPAAGATSPARSQALASLVTAAVLAALAAGYQGARSTYDGITGGIASHRAELDALRLAVAQYGGQIAAVAAAGEGLGKRVDALAAGAADAADVARLGKEVDASGARVASLEQANERQIDLNRAYQSALDSLRARLVPPPGPAPVPPEPAPAPAPPPPPAPAPTPQTEGYKGPLFALLVLPDAPTPALAALRVDADVRAALTAAGASWHTCVASSQQAKDEAVYLDNDPPPVVLWIREDGSLAKPGKADKASVLADLKEIRGS